MRTSSDGVLRKSPLRLIFIGVLIAVIVVQLIAMVTLMQSQVRSAEERGALDASSRLTAARCFESSAQRAMDLCLFDGAPRKITEVIENPGSSSVAGQDQKQQEHKEHKEHGRVVPVGFAAAR